MFIMVIFTNDLAHSAQMSEIKNGRLGLYGTGHSKCNHMMTLGFKGLAAYTMPLIDATLITIQVIERYLLRMYYVCVMCFQRQLADVFMELGEIDQALDDVLGLLHETEADLLHCDSVSGDPNFYEVFLAKVQVVCVIMHATVYLR